MVGFSVNVSHVRLAAIRTTVSKVVTKRRRNVQYSMSHRYKLVVKGSMAAVEYFWGVGKKQNEVCRSSTYRSSAAASDAIGDMSSNYQTEG